MNARVELLSQAVRPLNGNPTRKAIAMFEERQATHPFIPTESLSRRDLLLRIPQAQEEAHKNVLMLNA
jgi:hypothetical protein